MYFCLELFFSLLVVESLMMSIAPLGAPQLCSPCGSLLFRVRRVSIAPPDSAARVHPAPQCHTFSSASERARCVSRIIPSSPHD